MGLLMLGWATFGSLVIGALYVLTAPRSASLGKRLLGAAYAPSAALLFAMVYSLSRFPPAQRWQFVEQSTAQTWFN